MPYTSYTKHIIAQNWMRRGAAFIAAANLLAARRRGSEDVLMVSLHLLCQGTEILLKGLLLDKDYDLYHPQLKKFGHKLDRLADQVISTYKAQAMKAEFRQELSVLSHWYSRHWLRYDNGLSFVTMSGTPSYLRTLRRVCAVIRVVRRRQP
jgi:hypothetical protein